jgi:hypothetical protein
VNAPCLLYILAGTPVQKTFRYSISGHSGGSSPRFLLKWDSIVGRACAHKPESPTSEGIFGNPAISLNFFKKIMKTLFLFLHKSCQDSPFSGMIARIIYT